MADSFSYSNCADTGDCSSESNLSLSVGYYPNEDTFFNEKTNSCKDTSSNNPSIHFVPPFQGSWQTESKGTLLERQDQIQDSTEQFGQLNITPAWDGCNHSDSIINWDLHGDNQWIDQNPEEKTKLTLSKLNGLVQRLEQFLENQKDDEDDEFVFPESAQKEDFQLSSSTPPDVAQVSHQEHDACLQDLPMFNPPENDAIQCPQPPPKLQEHELAETKRKATGRQRTSTTATCSISSDKLKKEDTHSSTQPLSFLNFRWVFRWLRQRVLSFWGREHPKKAPKNPHKPTQRKRFSHRSKIQPQEPIEGEYPIARF
ncbi:hypothetical protein MDA_GLEAN10012589 [Myotis davidii]|uniref:Uncharacterized protein n=1 Tax=Myotis davidii TaxID=225400 RepID=L5M5H4_MYODS|nr:hypothetical protein MDA_GLEAN10012589 [Myotis davidii]